MILSEKYIRFLDTVKSILYIYLQVIPERSMTVLEKVLYGPELKKSSRKGFLRDWIHLYMENQ